VPDRRPPAGAFAARHVDCLFMVIPDEAKLADEITALRAGQDGSGLCSGHLLCRATPKETQEYYHYLVMKRRLGSRRSRHPKKGCRRHPLAADDRIHAMMERFHQRRRHVSRHRQL